MSKRTKNKNRWKRQRVYKATEGRCPSCGKVLWSGGPVRHYEFPLTCNGPGCELVVSAEMVVI